MCQDLWETLGKPRWMKHKLCCQRSHSVGTKTMIVWGRFCRGGMGNLPLKHRGVFSIDWWVAGCWEDPCRGCSRLWLLKFDENFVGGTRSQGSIASRGTSYAKVVRHGWDRTGREHLLDCGKSPYKVMNSRNLGGGCGRQVLRWHPRIGALVWSPLSVGGTCEYDGAFLCDRSSYTAGLTTREAW